MQDSHGIILTLLETIEHSKGPVGRIELCCMHWRPERPRLKAVATSRGVTYAGDPSVDASLAEHLVAAAAPSQEPLAAGRDDKLAVGEYVRFEGRSPVDGYLHLFNLGTSGACLKLAPSEEFPDNRVAAGRVFELPSPQFVGNDSFPKGIWEELGPATAETGHPERILFILTRDDIELGIEDLHPKLRGRDLYTPRGSRGPGFTGTVKRERAKLFRLDPAAWEYGLLSLDVVAVSL